MLSITQRASLYLKAADARSACVSRSVFERLCTILPCGALLEETEQKSGILHHRKEVTALLNIRC